MAGSRPGSFPRWWRYLATQESVDFRLRYDPIQPLQRRPRPATALVSAFVRTLLGLCHLAFRLEVVGSIPAEGCVLVSSHVSYLDGLLPTMLSARVTSIIRHCKPQPSAGPSARDWLLRIGKTIRAYALTIYGVIWAEGGSSITQGAAVVSAGPSSSRGRWSSCELASPFARTRPSAAATSQTAALDLLNIAAG